MKNEYNLIGVMSGTSMDGIDLVHVRFEYDGKWNFKILHADCVEYTTGWKNRLMTAIDQDQETINEFNQEYTDLLAQTCNRFLNKNNIENINASLKYCFKASPLFSF